MGEKIKVNLQNISFYLDLDLNANRVNEHILTANTFMRNVAKPELEEMRIRMHNTVYEMDGNSFF